jgi:hypothetical protein
VSDRDEASDTPEDASSDASMEPSARVESRWPWGILGVGVILLLTLLLLWIPSALAQGSGAFRDSANIVAPLLLLVYFALGRRMIGNAAAIVAAALLAISTPFVDATLGRHPILFAETLALAGIAWLIGIEAKHREVGLTGGSALEASVAGVLFGASLTIHPATFSTALAAIVLWLSLGLRRSRATTLPSRSPSSSIAWGIFGCIAIGLAGVATILALAAWTGTPVSFPATLSWSSTPEPIWKDAYRWMVSPFRVTDVLVIAAIVIVALIVSVESWTGSSWRGAGLLPWIYLLLYVLVGADSPFGFASAPIHSSRLPAPIPPLFVLGLGWLVLRGLSPGRVRRQEYTFLLVWLALAALLYPHAVASEAAASGRTETEALSVAALTILPMVVLVAARAARAFWETERGMLARVGILAFVCLPVITAMSSSVSNLRRTGESATFAIALDRWLPLALGVAASLGALSVLITVRPDPSIEASSAEERRPRFRGHRRRRGGRGRPHRGRPPRREGNGRRVR